jgi:uncharacterized protein (UPF0276 family)
MPLSPCGERGSLPEAKLEKALNTLPDLPGVGYKPQHFGDILTHHGSVGWLEVHAENYMGAGGRPIAQLRHLAERFPISVHGVGLSIGAQEPLDTEHLSRLKTLCDWLNPASFSEHLAWSTHEGVFLNDLLPLPYTQATLNRVIEHIDQAQHHLGRHLLLENPSTYIAFAESTMQEVDFMSEIGHRTGCGMLLDVNNVYVSSVNQMFDPLEYIKGFPLDLVGEIHLGGHEEDLDDTGARVLIDSHGTEVVDPVWDLYVQTITLAGQKPTLIEWDNDVPKWSVMLGQTDRAASLMAAAR